MAMRRIEQMDGLLGQRALRQQRYQPFVSDGRYRHEGWQLGDRPTVECTAAQLSVVVDGQHRFGREHLPAQFPSGWHIDA